MKYLIVFILLSVISCRTETKKPVDVKWSKEKSMELNKRIALEEKISIKLLQNVGLT